MAVVFELVADAPLRCRFAISPLTETTDAVRTLTRPDMEAYHLPWQRHVRRVLPGTRLGPLLAVFATSYQPDFLSPPPHGPFSEFTTSIADVRATPLDQVSVEMQRWRRSRSAPSALRSYPELAGEPARVLDLLADLLELAWQILVEPWWPQLRDVLDADITYRARRMADSGVAAALAELHPKLSYRDGAIRIAGPTRVSRTVGDEGLVLMPSVFGWPKAGVVFDPPWLPTLIYPARGIARLWHPNRNIADGSLARLVGVTRAVILTALSEPASTTGLAARCKLPPSTVSEHVTVLRDCGLVSTVRTGRYLVHEQTVLGTALAADPI
jgi:DNA-binding transcriptional ArsR family regulator